MDIKKLEHVNLREVWKNEAYNFTTWIEDNIEFLNEVLSFTINNVEREEKVGTFYADLKGIDNNGDLVIIENQLEKIDHSHLGQIITYLSNINDAKTAVWICKQPRPEHKEAIDWLNKFTGFSFYLIKIEAIKIGNSSVALLFSIISSPSEEMKEAGKKSKELSETQKNNFEFWSQLLNKLKEKKIKLYSNISPSNYCYITTGAGTSGLSYLYWITNNSGYIKMWIDKEKDSEKINIKIFEKLKENKQEIEKTFGNKLKWDAPEGSRHCKIIKSFNKGLKETKNWNLLQEEMILNMINFEKAIKPFVKKVIKIK